MVALVRRSSALWLTLTACHPVALTVPPAKVAGEHVQATPPAVVAIPGPARSPTVDTLDHHVTLRQDDATPGRGESRPAAYTVRRGGQDVWIRGSDRMLEQVAELYDVGPLAQTACPLLVAFDDTAVTMSPAPADAASFELGRAASCDAADWPDARTPWLAWDRDGSGAIEGGHELLGTATRLAPGQWADDGFSALSEADTDGNGRIDADDPAFAALSLWSDHNGDRRSSPDELTSLTDAGIEALPLHYVVDERCDARGNCVRERADVTLQADAAHRRATLIDVHARCR